MSPNQTTGGGASNGAAASFADQLRIARGERPQSAAAAIIARSVRTLQNWESARNVPDRAVQAEALAKLRKTPKRKGNNKLGNERA